MKYESYDLKSCPFCGSSKLKIIDYGYISVQCEECGIVISGHYCSPEEAVKCWNHRAEDTKE